VKGEMRKKKERGRQIEIELFKSKIYAKEEW
jgi:hypothetical protein